MSAISALGERAVRADCLGGIELEARRTRRAGGTARARPASSRSWLHRSVAARVCCRVGAARLPARKQPEPVVEPRRDRVRPERADPPGRELERERKPVEPEADPGDRRCVLVGQREPGRHGGGALDEEAHRLGAGQLGERRAAARDRGSRATGRGRRPRPRARSGSRVVATIGELRRRAQERVDDARCRRQARARSCRARAAAVASAAKSTSAWSVGWPGKGADIERGGDGVLDVLVAGDRGELDEGDTVRDIRPRPRGSSSSASLVFPAPPVPESVSSLVRASSERSSSSSRLRPTNELVSAGRPRGAGRRAERSELVLELGAAARQALPAGRTRSRRSGSRAAARRRRA